MSQPIHVGEANTDRTVVEQLLREQCPEWAGRPLRLLSGSGSDNVLWMLGDPRDPSSDPFLVRLPRTSSAAKAMRRELDALPLLSDAFGTLVSLVCHSGRPTDAFPHEWSVLNWIDGTDAWACRHDASLEASQGLAVDLAEFIKSLRGLTIELQNTVSARRSGERGGPIGALVDDLDRWLRDPRWHADALLDLPAVRKRIADDLERAGSTMGEGDWVLTHGDLIAPNVLVREGRLTAVIDWGSIGFADPAQDLSAAWAIFEPPARNAFREVLNPPIDVWHRARLTELAHAVAAILYYRPKGHPLADVMQRTLESILADDSAS